ncbi:4000_t:CDS:1, partial [Acaulospora colombiana]
RTGLLACGVPSLAFPFCDISFFNSKRNTIKQTRYMLLGCHIEGLKTSVCQKYGLRLVKGQKAS